MYYELYIDVFFLENFMMDSLLLLAVSRALKSGTSWGRNLLGGAVGSLLTCLTVVSPFPSGVKLLILHLAAGPAMLCTGIRITGPAQFLKAVVLLYFMSVLLGGMMQLFRPYMRSVSLSYAAAAAGHLMLSRLWTFLYLVQRERERIVRVTLYKADGTCVTADALWDTGNELRDYVTGEPVSIMDPGLAGRLSAVPEAETGFHLIPYRCVGGESLMQVFRIDKMCIHAEGSRGDGDAWIQCPVLGIGEAWHAEHGDYEMILNPEIFS